MLAVLQHRKTEAYLKGSNFHSAFLEYQRYRRAPDLVKRHIQSVVRHTQDINEADVLSDDSIKLYEQYLPDYESYRLVPVELSTRRVEAR